MESDDERSADEKARDEAGIEDAGLEHEDAEEPADREEGRDSDDEGEEGEYEDEEQGEDEEDEEQGEAQHDDDLGLRFDQAEVGSQAAPCGRCRAAIQHEYYEADSIPVCSACARILRDGEPGQTPIGRAMRALGFGLGAAMVSGLVWWGIVAATGYEIGLIAVGVGLAVGFAVRIGAHARGGWFYQTMAVVLTYVAITGTYVPGLMDELRTPTYAGVESPDPESADEVTVYGTSAPVAFVIACVLALFVPFLSGFENIIGIAIIAFALWEAWRVNRRAVKSILGPYALAETRGPPDE